MRSSASQIENGFLYEWIHSIAWLWPVLEILHFIGLSLLLGSLFIVDLRLAGCFRHLHPAAVRKLLPWAIGGFCINLGTGILFFAGDPGRYMINIAFQTKIVLLFVAGANALWYYWIVDAAIESWDADSPSPYHAKVIAVISLLCWSSILLLGRLIPYIGEG